ncbi:MAG: hypothetical protein AAFZ74_12085 [Pseudomonadota bacterium]
MLRATLLALTLVGAFSAAAHATGLKATQSVEVATVTMAADGTETVTYSPATEVEPGEQVRYTLTYTNEGASPAEDVSLVMPVPAEVTYLEGSIAGPFSTVTYSADNGETFMAREALIVAADDAARPAAAEDITHIKWAFGEDIPAEQSGQISFSAILK